MKYIGFPINPKNLKKMPVKSYKKSMNYPKSRIGNSLFKILAESKCTNVSMGKPS